MPYKVMIAEAPRKRIVKRPRVRSRVMTDKRISKCPDCGNLILPSTSKKHWEIYCPARRITQRW